MAGRPDASVGGRYLALPGAQHQRRAGHHAVGGQAGQVKLALGSILNMRIDPDAVKNDEKMDRMVSLLRTFCETGGNLVQFNFASNAVLRAAQKDPDQYRDLLVRVATYSAFFVELGPETQEDIINRNELE